MAEKLEEYNNSNLAHLMKEKKRIETLINNMHDPVIGLDENLKVIFANEEAIKITGISLKDFIGNHCKDLAAKNDLMRTLVQEILEAKSNIAGKNTPLKIYSDNKEGYFEKTILQISATPTGEQEKQIIGHVILLKNITEYKELDFAKTNFIAAVSHEFKTPISSIKMSLQLLENEKIGKLNDEQANLLDSIKEDANRLLKITGELLNITQVESGNIQLSIIPTDPKEIVLYAINATRTQAEQKQVKLEIHCEDSISKVYADSEKTAWVLTNLISNAIRYSYDNAIVKINIYSKENKVNIDVCDSGQGIAPQYKDKIFERYFRVPGTKKEGTGLGLSISKEFIEAQGGCIAVNSDFGKGSIFTITLNTA
jgi:PAS domain S-box-containing protein